MSTITGTTINHGITIGNSGSYTYPSPLTITSTGTVSGTGTTNAVYSSIANPALYNQGSVSATGNADGVQFTKGGSVGNAGTAGLIEGYFGVAITGGAGTVTNAATIDGTGAAASGVFTNGGAGAVTNTGTILGNNVGVYLHSSGSVANNAGLIEGLGGDAVEMKGGVGTVTNAGTILGAGAGVYLPGGGSVANTGTGLIQGYNFGVIINGGAVTNSATITGTGAAGLGVKLVGGGTIVDSGTISGAGGAVYFGGTGGNLLVLDPGYALAGSVVVDGTANRLEFGSAAGAGTVSGIGSKFINFATITVDAGARWTLAGNNTLGAGVTLSDLGTLTNTGALSGAGDLIDDSSLFNSGSIGVTATVSGGGYLDNETAGTIGTISSNGVGVGAGGTVVNSGSILSSNAVFTVKFSGAGSLTNSQSGYIGSGGVYFEFGGTAVNDGRIADTSGPGIRIVSAAGTVTNSGTIVGSTTGVSLAGGTVVDSGTISGTGTAIAFGGTGGNLLVLESGYHLGGVVAGSTGAGATNTLELGSAAGAGRVSAALNTEFVNFGAFTVDAGAQWMLSGTSTLGSGVSLTDLGTLTNTGTLSGAGSLVVDPAILVNSGSIGLAVILSGGGYLDNEAGTVQVVTGYGVEGLGAGDTVVNSGSILSPFNHYTVKFSAAGNLTNSQSGYIGAGGAYLNGGTVVNDGRIVDTQPGLSGLYVKAAGMVTNSGTILGTGTAGLGVTLKGGGTVVDSGRISGGATAVYFGGAGSNLLVLEHGYQLTGVVTGSSSATNTVELAGSVGAAVTASSTALGLANFQDVLFGAGGNDTFDVANTSGTLGVTISGFGGVGDIIDLTAIGTNGTVASQTGTEVTVTGSSGTVTLLLDPSDHTNFATVSDGTSGTDLIPCFRRGTLILTPDGEAAVEELAIGDRVVTLSGAARPVKWIGRRAYDPLFVAGNRAVLPIRVEAGVVGDGVPARDLWVSPEHALYLDGLLVPARRLVNGITICQVESSERLEYFHIELASHDVIFADGAPAESYVECDNRGMFHNAGEFAALYPDAPPEQWEFCAPRVEEDSAGLTAIRTALLARATALGRASGDPDLHLIADGEIVRAQTRCDGIYQFAVAAGTRRVALASRRAVPAEVCPDSLDGRALGVAVERIVLSDAGLRVEIGHNSPALGDGFHEDEAAHRWSDGRGCLPLGLLASFAGDIAVEVHLAASALIYPALSPTGVADPDATGDPQAAERLLHPAQVSG